MRDLAEADVAVMEADGSARVRLVALLGKAGCTRIRIAPSVARVVDLVLAAPPALLLLGESAADGGWRDVLTRLRGQQLPAGAEKVILMAERPTRDLVAAAREHGVAAVLAKPLVEASFGGRLRQVLRSPAAPLWSLD